MPGYFAYRGRKISLRLATFREEWGPRYAGLDVWKCRRPHDEGVRAVSVQNRTGLTSQAPRPVQRRLGLALLVIATAELMLCWTTPS